MPGGNIKNLVGHRLPSSPRETQDKRYQLPSAKVTQPYRKDTICKAKDPTNVEYALRDSSKPIGVSTYRVVSAVPDELRSDLPGPEQITKLLD
jgi:hypothetical protein